jgi:hypothetical protein
VSMSFAFEIAFSGPAGEARVIFDPLPTICVYFVYCNFQFGCIVGDPIPYLVF